MILEITNIKQIDRSPHTLYNPKCVFSLFFKFYGAKNYIFTVPSTAKFPYTIIAYATADNPSKPSRTAKLTYAQAKVPAPVATPPAGSYQTMPDVTLSLPGIVTGAEIWYTTNGMTPAQDDVNSTKYTGEEITGLTFPATISAIAYAPGYGDSDLLIAEYKLLDLGAQRPFFGQLHAHTAEYSDGSGTLMDAIKYVSQIPVRDNVDFVAMTDHSNFWDTTAAANPPAALNDKSLMTPESLAKWEKYKGTIAAFDAGELVDPSTSKAIPNPNGRVMMGGFEMTWSGGPGHINTFNSKGLISRNNGALNNKTNDAGMKLYYDTLILDQDPLANLSQFNHPGKTFGNFKDFAYYSPNYDKKMVTVEVGNGEGSIGSTGYFPSYEQYTLALDKGWHVAPANNQDNHKGNWGNSNTARTVVYADGLSEMDLLQGLKNLNVYSTEDKNLQIDYTINGQRMGYIFNDAPDALYFSIKAYDPDVSDAIAKIDIVTNSGRVVQSKQFSTNDVVWDFTLSGSDVQPGYYYVRVTQADKDLAVTAPIWIGKALPAGINSFEASSSTVVTDEAADLTVTLFNSSGMSGMVTGIEWIIDGITVRADTPNSTIDGAEMPSFKYTYTPTAPGSVNITVKATITINGAPAEFSASLTLDIKDASKLTYIGIDGSHYNEYVNGAYKDNMTNLAKLALRYGVRAEIMKTEADLIAAAQNPQYNMLILTAPTRRPALASMGGTFPGYSQDVIDAVAAFSASGRTVIITGWSNIYENLPVSSQAIPAGTRHMAEEQNLLLAAMGSTLRLSDDCMFMPGQTAGTSSQSQRFYLEDFAISSPLFAGVTTVTDQPFSAYGASSIYAVASPGSTTPASSLASNIQGLVFNNATTVSADFDLGYGNADGSSMPQHKTPAPPKYTSPTGNNSYLNTAVETVTHSNGVTSLVVASGGAFMSNFELQADAGASIYSNYDLIVNLIKGVAPEVAITPINAAKSLPEGTEVTIEGVATTNVINPGNPDNTGFMDCIYVQDITGGINVFPVASGVTLGQTVRMTGTVSSYQGEIQVLVTDYNVVIPAITPIEPTVVTTKAAMSPDNTGLLIKTQGVVSNIVYDSGKISQFSITDSSGVEALIYMNGYITPDVDLSFVEMGATISVIGLASIGENFSSSDPQPRIRVRDRNEITLADTTDPGTIPVTGISVSPAAISLKVNGKATLTAMVSPEDATDKAVTWTSDNENVAVVDSNGAVTAVSVGKAVITVRTVDGDFTATCKVTVTRRSKPGPAAPENPSETEAETGTEPNDKPGTGGSNPAPQEELDFDDVSASNWFNDAVAFMANNGFMNGVDENTFAPNDNTTRGMLATILWRVAGMPEATADNKFPDVSDKYYTDAIIWGTECGLLRGYADGNFGPDDIVTREQIATILFRYAEMCGYDMTAREFLETFSDGADASGYAVDALQWCAANGILTGYTDGSIKPQGYASRAEIAMLVMRFTDYMNAQNTKYADNEENEDNEE